MKHPEWILEHARVCLHSSLVPGSDSQEGPLHAQPHYTCNLTDPHFTHPNKARPSDCGNRCRLLDGGECSAREVFPEHLDT